MSRKTCETFASLGITSPATGAAGTDKGQDHLHQDGCNAALRAAPASQHDAARNDDCAECEGTCYCPEWRDFLNGLPALPFDDSLRANKITISIGDLSDAMREYGAACANAATRFRAEGGNTKPNNVPDRAATGTPAKSAPGEWISVEDQMPPEGEPVLTYGSKRVQGAVMQYTKLDTWQIETSNEWHSAYPPTHWMPLPLPPAQSQPAGSAKGGEHAPSKVAESSPVGADKEYK